MKQAVIIKGNIQKGTKGISVILDPYMEYEMLREQVAEKFKELSGFLKQDQMVVSFEGRALSTEEEQDLLDIITTNTEIAILYLMEDDPERELIYGQKLDGLNRPQEVPEQPEEQMFYKGTLRSGQVVESEKSVVIIGDVNPGGQVISGGSIVILGALKGVACAGVTGNREAFVVALEMKPTQIQIDNVVAKCDVSPLSLKQRMKKKKTVEESPKIAILRNNNIFIENIDRETMASL